MWHFNMRVIFGLILLTISFATRGQNYDVMIGEIRADTAEITERFKYIEHVRTNDTLCTSGIKKAERQAKDTLSFVIWTGSFGRPLRYENELNDLVKKQGLKFDYEFGGDVVYENQTQGCYKDYMDKKVFERFGKNFKTRLHLRADSLFLVNHINDTVSSWDCDKEPTFKNKRIGGDGIFLTLDLRNERTKNGRPMFDGNRQFIDISFVIDKQGNVSKFQLAEFLPYYRPSTEKEERLLKLATEEVKKNYSKWTPGEINGIRLNTTYVLRVQFKNAT
jgi:hypothetical protein